MKTPLEYLQSLSRIRKQDHEEALKIANNIKTQHEAARNAVPKKVVEKAEPSRKG
jgi:hypothetical protein